VGFLGINRSFTALSKAQCSVQISGGQLVELDLADSWYGVGLNDEQVAVRSGWPDVRLGVELIPASQPSGHGIVFTAAYIQACCCLLGLCQFLFCLSLCFAKDVFDNSLPGFRVVARSVAAFPATVFALADVALTVRSFFSRG